MCHTLIFSASTHCPVSRLLALVCFGITLIGSTLNTAVASPQVEPSARNTAETSTVSAAGPCVQPCHYSTGFEPEEGFTAGAWIGDGNQGASGGIFETWAATCSQASGSTSEGHVETANPFAGVQHLRIARDPLAPTANFGGCILDARVPSDEVAVANAPPIGPVTISAHIAIAGVGGPNFEMRPAARAESSFLTAPMLFNYYGSIYAVDVLPGGPTFVFVGTWDTSGAYHKYTIDADPCGSFRCVHGGSAGLACATDLDCPNGECRGRIDYLIDDTIVYTGTFPGSEGVDQLTFFTDNVGNPNHEGVDIDNVEIIRSPIPCPVICGDSNVDFGEECDLGVDGACPGQCVPPGGTGTLGEPECTCDISACAVSNDLPNGDAQVFANQFGWWSFTANAPAYAVETCGTNGYDSQLSVWSGTCDSLTLLVSNDDCYGGMVLGTGSDPLASCYNGAGAFYYPYNACTCVVTTEGQEYWVWDSGVTYDETTIITLTKRLACDNPAGFGACCDPFTGCVDVTNQASCDALDGVYSDRKTCMGVGDQCPPPDRGACCDRLTSICTETTEPACDANSVFNLGTRCASGVCRPDEGACCVQSAFNASCSITKDIDCAGVFTAGTNCNDVACGLGVIPAVSEWGLVILALTLLIGAKLRYRRTSARG